MASVVPSVQTPTIGLVQGSQAPTQILVNKSGNTLPQDGKVSAAASAAQPTVGQQSSTAAQQQAQTQTQTTEAAQQKTETQQQTQSAQQTKQKQQQEQQQAQKTNVDQQVAMVNKFLNDSGRASQFRASSDNKMIEEVNPATGEVVAEYSASTFEALARSVGITGEPVVDEHA